MALFDETQFSKQLHAALNRVQTVLDNTRHPQVPENVRHTYEDKYKLAGTLYSLLHLWGLHYNQQILFRNTYNKYDICIGYLFASIRFA